MFDAQIPVGLTILIREDRLQSCSGIVHVNLAKYVYTLRAHMISALGLLLQAQCPLMMEGQPPVQREGRHMSQLMLNPQTEIFFGKK